MDRRERLQDLNLALEGGVDQLTRAQRVAIDGTHAIDGLNDRLNAVFVEVVALRNRVREELMKELARPINPPTIRKGK